VALPAHRRCVSAQVKNRKLHEQFEELAAGRGGVFAGVNLFVNGFTIPSHLVRLLMQAHEALSTHLNSAREIARLTSWRSAGA